MPNFSCLSSETLLTMFKNISTTFRVFKNVSRTSHVLVLKALYQYSRTFLELSYDNVQEHIKNFPCLSSESLITIVKNDSRTFHGLVLKVFYNVSRTFHGLILEVL